MDKIVAVLLVLVVQQQIFTYFVTSILLESIYLINHRELIMKILSKNQKVLQ